MAESVSNSKTDSNQAPRVTKSSAIDKTVMIRTPQSMNTISATSRAIMDELRDRHKGRDRPGGKPLHPTELITLDKINEFLNKHSNLSEQAKSVAGVDQSIKQLADSDNAGRDKMVYFYPFLIKSSTKVLSKIALISPQTTHEVNVKNYREACFDYSKPMVDLILSSRAKRIKEIDENNPGNFLFQKNKNGQDWLYPMNGSLESEVGLLIRRGFKPYFPLPCKDFIDDFIEYGNEKAQIELVVPNYHIIIDEIDLKEDGTYQRQPEIIAHYRAQADGLEKFALEQLRKLADEGKLNEFKYKLNEFQREYVDLAPEGRRQSRGKVKILIELVKSFPFEKFNSDFAKNVSNTCNLSIRLLEKFLSDMDNLIDRKYSSIYNKLNKSLEKLITETTKNELTLVPIHFDTEVDRAGIKEEEKIKSFSERLKKDLTTSFGYHTPPPEENPKNLVYFVDQGFMASVLHKLASLALTSTEHKKQLGYAKVINQELTLQKNPKLNVNIKSDHVSKLTSDVNQIEQLERERLKKEAFQKKFNITVGLVSFIISLMFFLILSLSDSSFATLVFGFLISIVIGISAGLYFRKKDSDFSQKESKVNSMFAKQDSVNSKGSDDDSRGDEKTSQIARAASSFVFPKKYNTIEDKIFDINTIRAKIQSNLEDIKKSVPILAKESDLNKVASSIEYSLITNSVVIAIPNDLVPKGKPQSLIINKEDFKSPLLRNQMSEHFRAVAEKNKYDTALVKYYTFLINTFELEYYKFLNKKIG